MKMNHLFDLESLKKFSDEMPSVIGGVKFHDGRTFKDAYAGTVLERNLTQVDPTVFEKKYPELTFFNLGISSDNSGGYAKRIQSLRVLEHGEFSVSGDRTSNKGKISISGEDNDILVIEKQAFAEWTDTDVQTASLQNYSLTGRLMSAIDKQYKREIDTIGFVGQGTNLGLLNNTDFASTGAGGAIGTLTPQDMYDEVCALIIDQHNAVSNTPEYMADTVVFPIDVLNTLQKTMLDTASTPASVLSALQFNFAGVSFTSSVRCNDVGGSSVSCAIKASDDTMKFRLPAPLTVGEIIKKSSFNWMVDAKYRVAGLDILESTAGRLLTGL